MAIMADELKESWPDFCIDFRGFLCKEEKS